MPDAYFGSYTICRVCGWEDDDLQLANPACGGGANTESLIEAQAKALVEFPLALKESRGSSRDPAWRPLSDEEIEIALREREARYWRNKAVEDPSGAYWTMPFPKPRKTASSAEADRENRSPANATGKPPDWRTTMPSTVILSLDTIRSFALCDASLLGLAWEADGRDLALRLRDGDGRLVRLTCSWASGVRVDLTSGPGCGGSPLCFECRCEPHGAGWRIALEFPPFGCIGLECNEARLEFDER